MFNGMNVGCKLLIDKSFHNLFKYFDAELYIKENIVNNLHFYTNFIDYVKKYDNLTNTSYALTHPEFWNLINT